MPTHTIVENNTNETYERMAGDGGGVRMSGRPNGKETWRENIRLLREKADRYEALLNALPDTLSVDADTALWLMAHKILQHP